MYLRPGMLTASDFESWLPPPYEPIVDDEEDDDGIVDLSQIHESKGKPKLKSKTKEGKGNRASGGRKRCTKCGKTRDLSDFRPHDTTSDGYAAYCRFCQNDLNKDYRDKNVIGRIKHHFATRVADQYGSDSLPEGYTEHLESYLGYRIRDLVTALEAQLQRDFPEEKNVLSVLKAGWHIDHIRPLSSYRTDTLGDEGFRACWAIDNLRVIPAQENLEKGSSLVFDLGAGESGREA